MNHEVLQFAELFPHKCVNAEASLLTLSIPHPEDKFTSLSRDMRLTRFIS